MTPVAIEGRCRVEGILEGPLPPVPGFAKFLEQWAADLARHGLGLVVSIDGGRFDVLAPDLEIDVPDVGRGPTDELASGLEALLAKVPDGERARLHSTLRTIESGRGFQTRTLFALRHPGTLERVEDRVETATAPPLRRVRTIAVPRWASWILIAAVAALMIVGMQLGWFGASRSIDPASIGLFSAPGTVELVSLRPTGARTRDGAAEWVAELRRDAELPQRPGDAADAASWSAWIGAERGRGELVWRDTDGRLLRVDPIDLATIPLGESGGVLVPEPPQRAVSASFGW